MRSTEGRRVTLPLARRRALLLAALAAPLARAATAPAPVTFTSGLDRPWGLAFLPDGRLLVTQKSGALVFVSADGRQVSAPLGGVPEVADSGQGGLLDVALDPDFATRPDVYLSYAERDGLGSGTAVARGRLAGAALRDTTVIFRQQPKVWGSGHFGARLVFARDKTLFVTLGERQKGEPAQDLASHLGKVVRLNRDGSVPADNPRIPGARPEIWSYGHRNPQGAALHPRTGELWLVEHGPQGGDELNIARAGGNYGWPQRSFGCPYGAPVGEDCRIGGGAHADDQVGPLTTWTPTSIAPSGMAFCSGRMFPEWRGNLFVGALAGTALWRLTLDGERVVAREALYASLRERIRDVREAPDGALLLLTDSRQGRILRVAR
ncbi:MAG: PQQ-dependent sugar dehydrogenase [Piscinibacter sp.]|nr:PQQ-dependent sugar dehydrogenase [Piscinibacter sp.]